jgi:hypothetical protein
MYRSKITLRVLLCSFFGIILAYTSTAATIRSQANGNWSNVNTWAGGVLPQPGDGVIISAGNLVNLNQTTANALSSLTIENSAVLRITIDGSGIHLNGNLVNDGELTIWLNNAMKGTLFFEGNGNWSGIGIWNLSAINLADYNWEFADNLILKIADNISGNPSSSFNTVNRRINTEFNFNGSQSAVVVSDGAKYIYPSIVIDKPALATVSLLNSGVANMVTILGGITILKASDILDLGTFNSLVIDKNIIGSGSLAGSDNSDLFIGGAGVQINPLRFKNLTHFNNIQVTRVSGVVFENSFTVLNELFIDAASKITLPSNATITIGQNGATPTLGKLTCNGLMFAGLASGLTVRGNDVLPVFLKFSQSIPGDYTLLDLDISRATGAGEAVIPASNSIILDGALDVRANNSLSINGGKLFLNFTITINAAGYLTGSDQSELYIQGNGGNATLRFNPNGSGLNRTLKYLFLNRTPGRIITIGNTLNVVEQVNVVSGKINANGFLTLISSASKNAGINSLGPLADILGDVIVQSYFTGGAGLRGTRTLASPVTSAVSPSVYKQLQNFMFITGSGLGGFDNPGSSPSLYNYKESASVQDGAPAQFTAITDLNTPVLAGEGFFLLFRGDRINNPVNKLNPPFAVPESFAVSYAGPINKGNISIPATVLTYTNRTEDARDAAYNGYHLIGNPYPSTIDWELVSKVNMENIVSIIKPGSGMITYSNGFVTNGGPPGTATATNNPVPSGLPNIQTGQGFYVRAKPGGGTITFTESCKSVLASPDRLLSKPANELLQSATVLSPEIKSKKAGNFIRLELCNAKNTDETIIVFTEGGDAAYSTGDAVYFAGSTVSLSSLTADMQNVAINFMPAVDQMEEVKLKVDATAAGKVKLKFTDIHLPREFEVFLKDDYLHTLTNVRSHCVYEFIIDKANPVTFGSARFSIILKDNSPVVAVDEMNVYPNPVSNILNVKVPAGNIRDMRWAVYDVMGYKCLSGAGVQPAVGDLPAGLYLIKVTDGRNNKVVGRSKFLKE